MYSKKNDYRPLLLSLLFTGMMYTVLAQLCIHPGGAVTVKNGTSLFVGTDLSIHSTDEGSGYLVDQTLNYGVSITGNISVERFMTSGAWHNVSVPTSNANSTLFDGTDLVFYYDETIIFNDWNFGWVWHEGALDIMRGYDLYIPDDPLTINYASSNPADLNTGHYSINVSLTNVPEGEIPDHKGWNLLGNPYPSPIDWMAEIAWDKTSINDAKYIWDPVGEVYTIFIGGPDPIGINGGTQFIPSNQGFWVQANENGLVSVNNQARVGQTPLTPDYYKYTESSYPILRLVAMGNEKKDEIIIRFIEGTTKGFDKGFDAIKLFTASPEVPQLAIKSNARFLALNSIGRLEADLEVPLFFKAGKDGLYTIVVSPQSRIDSHISCYIKDTKTGSYTKLGENTAFHFDYKTSDRSDRFSILFNPTAHTLANEADSFRAFSHQGLITVINHTGLEMSALLVINNMMGQKLFEKRVQLNNVYTFDPKLPSATYVVSIISGKIVSQHKISFIQ